MGNLEELLLPLLLVVLMKLIFSVAAGGEEDPGAVVRKDIREMKMNWRKILF